MHELDKKVISVRKLLTQSALSIPDYQRPYKWSQENLNALLVDLRVYRGKNAYRLGTVVFHQHSDNGNEQLDIVDGQQRTLTLLLLVKALIKERLPSLKREDLKVQLRELDTAITPFLARQHFSSDISHNNLHHNFMAALRAMSRPDFTEEDIDFLLNKCELVTFVLTDVSEAFQFFDSQNARGRDLEPHDLLKAFHLREFSEAESHLKAKTVSHWEDLNIKALSDLFSDYLYRIRQWTRGNSARYFGKDDVPLFKGVSLEKVDNFPYVNALRIAHHFVDDYNQQYQRKLDGQAMTFPFHLDQMLINGRRFFEMARHYEVQIKQVVTAEHSDISTFGNEKLSPQAIEILKTLNDYPNKKRTGDQYVRSLFDCLLVYYIDKFGFVDISRAIEKIFIWAYRLRIRQEVVQLASMDNYVLENNWFIKLKESIQPSDFLSLPLISLSDSQNNNNKIKPSGPANDPLVKLFKGMNYYE